MPFVRAFLVFCCLFGILANCSDGTLKNTNDVNQNNQNGGVFPGQTEWSSKNTIPTPLQGMTLCDGSTILKDVDKQKQIVSQVMGKVACIEQLGTWFHHQPCILVTERLNSCNTSNPPQCFFKLSVQWSDSSKGTVRITYFDKSSSCKINCMTNSNSTCKDLFSVLSYKGQED